MAGNPFLLDLVTEIMLEEANVHILKSLREMNNNCNQLALKELEKRAVEDQLKQLDFSDEKFQDNFDQFLKETAAIPQLFHSFRFNFPKTIRLIDSSFFMKYTPMFFRLEFNCKLKFTDRVTQYLVNIFNWLAPTLQELEVVRLEEEDRSIQMIPSSFPANGHPIVFHKLNKFIWKMGELGGEDDTIPFKFILDKSGAVDPTPNLTTLEACIDYEFLNMACMDNISTAFYRWSQLTTMRIFECCDDIDNTKFTDALISLGQAGMSLKNLALSYSFPPVEESTNMCENWSYFLATQAKSLQVLELNWFLVGEPVYEKFEDPEIKLPIFENLQTLHLFLNYEASGGPVQIKMFKMIQIPVHFPKLVHLQANQQGFQNMFPLDGEPIRLKSLAIKDKQNKLKAWTCIFPSVESLTCEGSLWEDLSWKESLNVLEIDGVSSLLKVSHLTNLRELVVREQSTLSNLTNPKGPKTKQYLTFFQQVLSLKLSCITFRSSFMPSEEVKARFICHFPFPVKFKPIIFDKFDHFPFKF